MVTFCKLATGLPPPVSLLTRVPIRPWLWSNYNRIKYEMGSHKLLTVPDYNWITITSNNPLGAVWSIYSAWLNKMVVVVWGNQTFGRVMEWRGGATWVKHHAQQETRMGQNKSRNGQNKGKCLLDLKLSHGIRCCCFSRRNFLLLAFEATFAFLLASKSSIGGQYHGSAILFVFLQMWTEPLNKIEWSMTDWIVTLAVIQLNMINI